MENNKLILNNVLYVPAHLVTPEMRDAFTYKFTKKIKERKIVSQRCCGECKKYRHKDCIAAGYTKYDQVCKKFEPPIITRSEQEIIYTHAQEGNNYIFGRGDLGKIRQLFGHLPIEDQRAAPVLGFDLQCKTALYEEQQRVVNEWLQHGYGIIKAPTAFGKSVMWVWLVAYLKMRTLLLAQEVRHLDVCYNALYEHTNIAELEKEYGVEIAGRLNYVNKGTRENPKYKKEWGKTYPISFSTFQGLSSKKGLEVLSELKNYYGTVFNEECHHSAAETFHWVTRSFNSWYRGGQTATPTRKDQYHFSTYDTIGPITAQGLTEQMTPKVTFIHTDVKVPAWIFKFQYPTVKLHTWLSKSYEYQGIVFDWLMQDIRDGRKAFVFTERRDNATWLARQVEIAGYNAQVIMSGTVANIDNISQRLLDGRLACIVGTKVLQENVNIPPLDVVHLPFSNFGKEKEEQIVGRIRRYIRDPETKQIIPNAKPQPLIRVYTYVSDVSTLPQSAIQFRRSLYKTWGFDFDEDFDVKKAKAAIEGVSDPLSGKKKTKNMKEWLDSFKE